MARRLTLVVCSASATILLFSLGAALGVPLPWLPGIGLAIAGVMWWGWPWALGAGLAMTALSIWMASVGLVGAAALGGAFASQGLLPEWAFKRFKAQYDLSTPSALATFLIWGVLLNTLLGAVLSTLIWWAEGQIPTSRLLFTIALNWLSNSLIALKLTLPLLRFTTYHLNLNGLFGTPAALQRGIVRPSITRRDVGLLAAALLGLAALVALINTRLPGEPQLVTTLFLLPMIWFAVRRGFDGALLAATASSLVCIGLNLRASGYWPALRLEESAQGIFATVVFELGLFYLVSIMIGMLLDSYRAEQRRLATLLNISTLVNEHADSQRLLQRLNMEARAAIGASAALIERYQAPLAQGDPSPLERLAVATAPGHGELAIATLPVAISAEVLASGSALIRHINDPGLQPATSAFFAATGFVTLMVVPLTGNDGVVGLMAVFDFRPERHFTAEELELLQAMGAAIAGALEEARLQSELEHTSRAKQEAQELLLQTERLRAVGELASGVAHDFNNLLAGILGHTQLLLLDASRDSQDSLAIIEQAARDGTQMIKRLQRFARAQQSQSGELIDLNQIVNDVIQLAHPRWRTRSSASAIRTEIQAGDVPAFSGSAFELREVLINLVFNAVDAMPSGGVLTIRTAAANDGVVLEVADTGVGMSKATQDRMWTPFFTTKGSAGTGLGLTMTHAIVVQQHGGHINVQSAEGQGTTITLWLPIPAGSDTALVLPASASGAEQRPGRILLVENDPLVQSALTRLLRTWGHQADCIATGQQALADHQAERWEIAIVDVGLTDMSAWELLGALKTRDLRLKVVLLSGWGSGPELEQRGPLPDAILRKPFEADAVRSTITTLLALQQPVERP